MARAQASEASSSGHVTETITYVPGNGDPPIVQWGGHLFHANVAKELTGHPDGTKREQLNHELIMSARNNPHFTVGGAKRSKSKTAAIETADQYRGYLADWMKAVGADGQPVVNSASALIERFAKEKDMRVLCEVGSSDYELIAPLFMSKLGELAKADELTEEQVGALWLNHGFNELPW